MITTVLAKQESAIFSAEIHVRRGGFIPAPTPLKTGRTLTPLQAWPRYLMKAPRAFLMSLQSIRWCTIALLAGSRLVMDLVFAKAR